MQGPFFLCVIHSHEMTLQLVCINSQASPLRTLHLNKVMRETHSLEAFSLSSSRIPIRCHDEASGLSGREGIRVLGTLIKPRKKSSPTKSYVSFSISSIWKGKKYSEDGVTEEDRKD